MMMKREYLPFFFGILVGFLMSANLMFFGSEQASYQDIFNETGINILESSESQICYPRNPKKINITEKLIKRAEKNKLLYSKIYDLVKHPEGNYPRCKIDGAMKLLPLKGVEDTKPRVLCWIMTNPENHKTKAVHVKATWGRRCHKLLFISTEKDDELDTVVINTTESYDHLWGKTRGAFQYIYDNYRDSFDFFLKADDDTYVIMENLRLELSAKNASEPLYMGSIIANQVKTGYTSGGAGYVLSRESLRRLVAIGFKSRKCKVDSEGVEDVLLGECLYHASVRAIDPRDYRGRSKFLPFPPEQLLIPECVRYPYDWYHRYSGSLPRGEGFDCCSDYPISFHYISPEQMYVMEYLIYRVKLFEG